MRGAWLLMAMVLTLTACASDPATRGEELAAQIEVGKTTKREVLQLFGFPARKKGDTSSGKTSEVWVYVYADQSTAPAKGLVITFDETGVVSAISSATQIGTPDTPERPLHPLELP
jgi:outer membrane protein assembly factor BamE (lipoprotein component of BamABCDE complex)